MKIAVLTGAGMSAESGLNTFRDSNGLWEGHDVMSVASPEGFQRNPTLVLNFYNERRRQLLQVQPNSAHIALAELEKEHEVVIITQNVDDLHERAGSSRVVHLHGELLKVRSTFKEDLILDWREDLNLGDFCEFNHQLRPHIVWFGEMVPMMEVAMELVAEADVVIIVGTSMQVYPAAGLVQYASYTTEIYFVDPNPSMGSSERITVFAEKATTGVPKVIDALKKL
ncbi:NAD-dependent deacetylase [Ulvibacter sp. MAR_2010_11]|uniref:SIR2 family NAD-dependent protein deacylase n=1 Tax=Ulvibacter sp. MAR_2010_11 TaxID=1250229 RepID=UPI000C2BCD85|nr:NAD-dependent deacylase [Ulvibacter sp. MAR_2010_11]PKA83953.1 NAD-dependent deacetylase [Ulvibacter sp. MAR_2010_11]